MDDPVAFRDHIQVMLDEHDAVAGVHQSVQDAEVRSLRLPVWRGAEAKSDTVSSEMLINLDFSP
jgi:hypothetical protein